MSRRVVVVGAGAAGTMAALFAARTGADTHLLERTRDGGRKILISGGGRCNVLPARVDERRFVTDSSPHLLRRMLRAWPLAEQRAFFEDDLGLPLVEEPESGKLFPASQRARDVRDGLLARAVASGARFVPGTLVTGVRPAGGRWVVERAGAPPVEAEAVVLATGGLSVPNTGSDGTGLRLLGDLGHRLHPTYPALTPVTADPAAFGHLAGVSLAVTLTAAAPSRRAAATGGFLFTHRGYSGPAVLDVSHVITRSPPTGAERAALRVAWTALDDVAWAGALRPAGRRAVAGVLRERLPDRLADALLTRAACDGTTPLAQLTREARQRLVDTLVRGDLPWTGHEGYRKAEVTGGGLDLADLDARTLQSRRHPGLFVCGEALDAFGPIGGYNFLWAWATGRTAGIHAGHGPAPAG
jgi:predicted Rossmann fold flavoprotein